METTKCLNEWNAIIEALGQKKQTILIRKYTTNATEFLLYPTISYANKDDILKAFKKDYDNFIKNNLLPNTENKKHEVKYYAKVDSVIEKSSRSIGSLNKFHIWNKKHVKEYLGKNPAKIWILRVYKLDEPQLLKKFGGIRYFNVDKSIKLKGQPVLSDDEFNKLKEAILNK